MKEKSMEMSKKKAKVTLSVKLDCHGEDKMCVKDDKPDDQVKERRISKRLASQHKSLTFGKLVLL